MDIEVSFPGGMKVDAKAGRWVISTDQSEKSGGSETAPEPYTLFLASLATCAGIYVLRYLQVRGLPTEGLKLVQRHAFDEKKHRLQKVELEITLPAGIEEKHRKAIERTAASCAVKRTIENPPLFEVKAV
ncbi:MAG: osmotically inducible protein OsmC [Deltaproteobacteria bacterium]|nr:MAG: osmotically inducible protein OsmC [Deltaproteobacteria bacterium]